MMTGSRCPECIHILGSHMRGVEPPDLIVNLPTFRPVHVGGALEVRPGLSLFPPTVEFFFLARLRIRSLLRQGIPF